MKLPMPAAVLGGGASQRMGVPKGSLPYGNGTLAEHQTRRLSDLFSEVWFVAREEPAFAIGPARVLFDSDPIRSAMSGLLRALEEAEDRVLVLAVDLPLVPDALLVALAERSLASGRAAVLAENEGNLEPLGGVWRRAALEEGRRRAAAGNRSIRDLAHAAGLEVFPEREWRALDPSGNAWINVNTMDDWLAARTRA